MITSALFLERKWFAISPNGEETEVSFQVEAPVERTHSEWTARVTFSKLGIPSHEIHGIDSWQAVEQAMIHAAKLALHLESLGWRFFWDEANREPARAAGLFKGTSS